VTLAFGRVDYKMYVARQTFSCETVLVITVK